MAGPAHDHAESAITIPDAAGRAAGTELETSSPASTTRSAGMVRGQRAVPDPIPVDQAPRRDRLSRRRVLALQRSAGNRAVTGVVRGALQRVEVKEPKLSETLYNQKGAGGKAGSKQYTLNPQYEITRQDDSGVTVTVRVQFLSQTRNTTPKPANAPPGTPDLGDLVGDPTEIPADDPRRAWATNVVQEGVTHWNGRLTLVGEETSLFSSDVTKKRLPVSFRAEPVFGVGESAHSRVIVHPSSIVAGTPGNPIDAGNYYMNKGGYTGDEKVIAAHEYGHLLGIPDEYSQSNEQLNALIHQAAPGNAASAGNALDKATIERMVLMGLKRPMLSQLDNAMPQLVAAIQAQRTQVTRRMAAAARTGAASADVRTQLRDQLTEQAAGQVAPNVPGVVAFQTTTNFSNITQAGTGVSAGFATNALSTQVRNAYWKALGDAESKDIVAIQGLGDVSINIKGPVAGVTATGGAQATAAAGAATTLVGTGAGAGAPAAGGGAAAAGGGAPGLPAITPPATLIDKLSALPTTWSAAGSALETGITPDRFAAKMVGTLKAAQVVAKVASLAGIGGIDTTSQLYKVAYALVTNAAQSAARELAAELIGTTMTPVLVTGVSDLQSAIATEVDRVMGTPASGVGGLGTPDPGMTAVVSAMKARLDADKTATAGTGRDPLGKPGGTAPDQDVTYSYQGLMGSNATTALRPDQFGPMVKQFNDRLTKMFEKPFTAETR
jgi:hypothetical protein